MIPSSTKKQEGVGKRKKMDMSEEGKVNMKEEQERAERAKLRCIFN